MKPIVPASHFLGIRGSSDLTGDDIARIIGFGILAFLIFLASLSNLNDRQLAGFLVCLGVSGVCVWYGIRPAFSRKQLAIQAAPIAEKFALSGEDALSFSSVQSGRDDMSSDAFVRLLLQKNIMRNVMVDDKNGCFVLLREPLHSTQTMPTVQVVSVPQPTVVTVPIVQMTSTRTCPRCGVDVELGARFCPSCGRPFVCQNCGHDLSGAEDFCPNCGNSLS